MPPDDLDGYARVSAGQSIPVAAGESEFGIFGFRERRRASLLNVTIRRDAAVIRLRIPQPEPPAAASG